MSTNKKQAGKTKANKLRLNKETLKDLDTPKGKDLKGGKCCSRAQSGCIG